MNKKALWLGIFLLVSVGLGYFIISPKKVEVFFQLGDSKSVRAVAYSPDGRTVVSGSEDNTLKLWDVASGRELRTLKGHSDSVSAVAYSPDGRTLVSGSEDNTLKLWDVASGQELRTLKGHSGSVLALVFSPDGRMLASGSRDDTLKLWDAASGRELRTLKGRSSWVWAVAFSPDGRTLVSGSFDGTTRLWNPQTGQEIAQMVNFKDGEWITITPEGYYTASANGEKYLNVRIDDQVYGIDNFKTRFHRPDIVKLALELGDTQKAIAQLNAPSPAPVAAVTASPQVATQSTAKVEPSPPPIQTGPRLALVIGNTNYAGQRLINPANDAEDMEQVLKQLGFTVRRYNDLDLQKLSQAISAFMDELRQSPNAVALFYYAGHGAEVAGAGYLLPIAHGISQEVDVPYRAYAVAQVMDNLKAAHHGVNIVIVDACRNNPFGSNSPVDGRSRGGSASRGLQRVNQVPLGSLIASSTSSGDVADDGAYGRNSPYTTRFPTIPRYCSLWSI